MIIQSFFRLFHPDITVAGTVLEVSVDLLLPYGIKGIILDVDDTLVPFHQSQVPPEIREWLQIMQQHFQIWLVSNNMNEQRIRQIAQSLEVPHIHRAAKPSRQALRKAIEAMDLPLEQVAIVGDRLWTDILAGNRLGILTVLVQQL